MNALKDFVTKNTILYILSSHKFLTDGQWHILHMFLRSTISKVMI